MYRTLEPYPHTSINLKVDPKLTKSDEYELVMLLSPMSEQEWSVNLCNFQYWEKTLINQEYEGHDNPLAQPAYTYIKMQEIDSNRELTSFVTIDQFLLLLYKPFEIELSEPIFSVYIANEEKLPIWFCAVIPRQIYAGVAITISQFDKESSFLGSTVVFLDDHSKLCFETEAPQSSDGYMLIEMNGDTTYMERAVTIPIKIELNLGGAITKTIIESKWAILTQVLAISMLRAILSTDFIINSPLKLVSGKQR